MKVFEFIINPEDKEMGMKAISLVDKPAMESEFIAFNRQEKKKVLFKIDDKKYIVAGLALIPDKLVYRVDEETQEEYMGFFSAETIEMIQDKFMKEATNGTLSDVNFQHNSNDKAQAHLVESYILRTEDMVNAVKKMGIEDAVLGAWFVAYKFDSFEDYDKAVENGFTGFSIEIMLQRELKMSKNNIKNQANIVMAKIKNFVDKFKAILNELESEDINGNKFEDAVVPESGKSLRIGEVGTPVLWVSVDEAGQEVTEPVQEGEYVVEDGRMIVVDAMGNLVEIKEAGTPVEPINPEEMTAEEIEAACKKKKEGLAEEEMPVNPEENPVETPAASGETSVNVAEKKLGELVDVSKDGEYYIYVNVSGGQIVEATVEAEQALVKAQDFNAVKTENEDLKTKLAAIKVKPAFTEFTQYPEKKVDTSKMNNLELTRYRLGLLHKG